MTSLFLPQSSLFEVFLVGFRVLSEQQKIRNSFLHVCAERLTGWPTDRPTREAIAEKVQEHMENEVIVPFVEPSEVLSDISRASERENSRTSRNFKGRLVLQEGIVRTGQVVQTVTQANVTQVVRLIEEIRKFEYRVKHRKRMAHSRHELPELDTV